MQRKLEAKTRGKGADKRLKSNNTKKFKLALVLSV